MASQRNRPILVTGSHRSGTTWVGEMIASHPQVVYTWEPFNYQFRPKDAPLRHWFEQVTPDREPEFRAYLRRHLEFAHPWWGEIRERPTPRRLVGATLRAAKGWWHRLSGCRPLMKDPIALFSAEWLAQTYDMDVIVLIRHPAAFISSLKRLNWRFGFGHFVQQPALLNGLLRPFADEIVAAHETYHVRQPDLVDEGILFWRLIHHAIREYQEAHPDWQFVRHEELSERPVAEFSNLFEWLGLEMTEAVQSRIESHTAEGNPAEAGHRVVHQMKRDSRANVWNWQKRLTAHEILRIRKNTEDVAHHFYTAADWEGGAAAARRAA